MEVVEEWVALGGFFPLACFKPEGQHVDGEICCMWVEKYVLEPGRYATPKIAPQLAFEETRLQTKLSTVAR